MTHQQERFTLIFTSLKDKILNNKISVTQWKNIISLIHAHMEVDNIPLDRLYVTSDKCTTIQSIIDNYDYHDSPSLSYHDNYIYCSNNNLNLNTKISYDNACFIANNFFNETGRNISLHLIKLSIPDVTNQDIN